MKTLTSSLLALAAALLVSGCLGVSDDPASEAPLAGGAMTVFSANSQAFSLPTPGLTPGDFQRHADGDAHFEAAFVTAPAPVNAGLGPLFNATSCTACHARDG